MVNVDPFTGVQNTDDIPLKIIRSVCNKNAVMGGVFGIRQPGVIQIGDNVYVEDEWCEIVPTRKNFELF